MMKNIDKIEAIATLADRKVLSTFLRDAALSLPLPFGLWSSDGQVVFPVYEEGSGPKAKWFCAYLFCPVLKIDGFRPTLPPSDPCIWFSYCFDAEKQTMQEAAIALARDIEEKTGRKFPGAR